jgi:hypothetical protein
LENNFNDIRLYSINANDTLEIPYVLKVKEDQIIEEIIKLPVLNQSKKNDVFFSFDTKGNTVNYLDLSFTQQNFNAYIKIEGSNDQLDWYELTNNQRVLSINTESIQYATTQVHFPVSTYQYLRISVKSDVPLTLLNASFKHQNSKPGVINTFTPSWSEKQDNKYKQTVIDIKLDDITPISKIEIDASNDLDYYRSFTLEYASDSTKTPKGWTVFYTQLFQGYLTSVNKNIFDFNFQTAKKLRLTINNRDNSPLTIKKITVFGPEVVLLAKLKPKDTYLFYGNKSLESPSYDLIRFKENIPDSLTTVTLEDEDIIQTQIESVDPIFANKHWLWVIIVLTIGIMGFFTLRMMKHR